jgi:hypothetical protein
VARPEKHAWFVVHRRDIPKTWPNFLFNEWVPDASHCVSHFRPFVKIDIFYFSENALKPSPWYALPVKILHDPHDVIKGLLQSSERLRFEVMEDDVDYSISKGLAAALEAFRRTQRGELLFAQTLLDELRHHIMQADDWLLDRTPEDAVYAKFDKRGSRECMGTLCTSFCVYDSRALNASLAALSRLYRRQIIQLRDKFALSRLLEHDLAALDPILSVPHKLDTAGHYINSGPTQRLVCGQFLSKVQMPESRQFDQRSPDGVHQVVFDE